MRQNEQQAGTRIRLQFPADGIPARILPADRMCAEKEQTEVRSGDEWTEDKLSERTG